MALPVTARPQGATAPVAAHAAVRPGGAARIPATPIAAQRAQVRVQEQA
jgi:hypothetical protein